MTASKTAQMAAAISLITLSWPAANALNVVPGNNPPIDSEVVRDACGLSSDSGVGRLITGCLQDNHAELVTFASDEALQFDAGGQSSVEAQDGLYSRLSITRPGQTISKLILNLEVSRDGVVSFFDGSTFSLSYVVRSNGSNFFTVTGPLQTLSLTTFVNTFGESTAEVDIIRGDKSSPPVSGHPCHSGACNLRLDAGRSLHRPGANAISANQNSRSDQGAPKDTSS
jgi:hypothetical protein